MSEQECAGIPDGKLGTDHLPDEVVMQPVTIAVWMTSEDDSPRRGSHTVGITLGDRTNPMLTPAESEYVAAVLQEAANKIRNGWAEKDGRGQRLTTDFEWPPSGHSVAAVPEWEEK